MIILVTLFAICYVAYAFWVINLTTKKFRSLEACLFIGLFCIAMPLAIIAQVLTWTGVIK